MPGHPQPAQRHWRCSTPVSYTHLDVYKRQEYVAAQPPQGDRLPTRRGYYQLIGLAQEVIDRGTASDFLHYELADFEVSILKSGRLGMSRDEPVDLAIKAYAEAAGTRAIRAACLLYTSRCV